MSQKTLEEKNKKDSISNFNITNNHKYIALNPIKTRV